MYSRPGAVVKRRQQLGLTQLDTLLVFSLGVLMSWGLQAQETIEILYDQSDTPTHSGSIGWVLFSVLMAAGMVALLWLYYRTHRNLQEKEQALERNAERLQEAQSIACIGTWERDFESGETFWSIEAKEILGYAQNSSNLKHYEALVHPDDVEFVTETMASAYIKGGSYQCDHRVVCPDGREKYIRLAGKVFLSSGNSPVRETGTVQDITERKLIELAVQRNEQGLRSILDAVPYPIVILEAGGSHSILYSNEGAQALFGFDRSTVKAEFDSRELWKDAGNRNKLLSKLEQFPRLLELEAELKDSSDRAFWALVSANKMDFCGTPSVLLSVVNISERKLIEQKLERLASLDSLTGLLNRREFFESADKEFRRALRYNQSFALLTMNIDSFKSVMERYGDGFGNQLLKRFGVLVKSSLRSEDLIGRMGGEEFSALLVAADFESSRLIAERIRSSWQKEQFNYNGSLLSFTVSIGVALQIQDGETVSQTLERADRCLYKAKQLGCNQVVLSSDMALSARSGQ